MMIICPATGLECQSSGCTSGIRSCDHWPKAIPTNDRYSAGFKAGREAGMREAAGLCQSHEPKDFTTAGIITRAKCAEVILSAIGGDK